MVKLFSDEEMDEMCKDYRSIPLELRSQVFSIDNENSKLPIGYVAPVNINQYSLSLHKYYGLDSMAYIEEYNKLYDKNIPTVDEPPESITPEEPKSRRSRRRRIEVEEAKLMGQEDVRDDKRRVRRRNIEIEEARLMGQEDVLSTSEEQRQIKKI